VRNNFYVFHSLEDDQLSYDAPGHHLRPAFAFRFPSARAMEVLAVEGRHRAPLVLLE